MHHPLTDGTRAICWSVREADERVHAVAAVPVDVPKETLGVAVTGQAIGLFVDRPFGGYAIYRLQTTVCPTPLSAAYNNGIVELEFAIDTS